LLLLYPDNDIA